MTEPKKKVVPLKAGQPVKAARPKKASEDAGLMKASDKHDSIVKKLLAEKETNRIVGEKLQNAKEATLQKAISILDKVFSGLVTITGSGTEAKASMTTEVVDAFARCDILEYRSQIEPGKEYNLFEMYYSILSSCGNYKALSSSITNRGGELSIASLNNVTKEKHSPSSLAFWAQHVIHEAVKSQSVDISNLDYTGVVPVYSVMEYLTKEKPKLVIQGRSEGQLVSGEFHNVKLERSWTGTSLVLTVGCTILHQGQVRKVPVSITMKMKSVMMAAKDLPFAEPTEEQSKRFIERGKRYFQYSSTPSYLKYDGHCVRYSWMGPRYFNSVGRVMIDMETMRKVDSNYGDYFGNDRYGELRELTGHGNGGEHQFTSVENLSDDILYMASPVVYGFSMKAKVWGEFDVEKISQIQFRTDAFDNLVLDTNVKSVIRSLVDSDKVSYTDIIENKGLGYIFLLCGGPGTGKTLTAEALAETLHRPIYYLSVGELGVEVEYLENKLKNVLEIAETWNAILLIDEIDIFVQKRTGESDIHRNAMTGVFLRLLEYYSGIMFLTTNLVDNLDPAFQSRVSLSIDYGEGLTVETREQIWRNLTKGIKIEGVDYPMLAKFNLNGRRIKNCIRLLLTLAASHGGIPTMKGLLNIIEISGNVPEQQGYHASSAAG